MLELFFYAFTRQGFLIEAFMPYHMASAGNPFFIPSFRINLPDPAGIPIACHTDEDVRIELSKKDIL